MTRRAAIIDTNVVVAGLITSDGEAPTARVLDGMIGGRFPFVLSVALLGEYRGVLLRDRIREAHGLGDDDIDAILTAIASTAIVREPTITAGRAPDAGDQYLWDLLASIPDAILVTGDRALLEGASDGASDGPCVVSAREFVDSPSFADRGELAPGVDPLGEAT